MSKEIFIADGFSYTKDEVEQASEIREMLDGEEKYSLIQQFESATRKTFPHQKPIKPGYNECTAHLSSLDIARGAAMVDMDAIRPRRMKF